MSMSQHLKIMKKKMMRVKNHRALPALSKSRCCLADDVFFAPMPDAAFTPHPAAVFMGSQWLNNRSPAAELHPRGPYRLTATPHQNR